MVGTPYYVDRGEVTGYDYIGVVEWGMGQSLRHFRCVLVPKSEVRDQILNIGEIWKGCPIQAKYTAVIQNRD